MLVVVLGPFNRAQASVQRKWDSQLARQDIRRAQRDDPQPRPAADQAVGHCRDRTIASGGHHGIKSLRDRPPDDRENIFSRARLVNPVLPASLRLVSFPGLADLFGRRVPRFRVDDHEHPRRSDLRCHRHELTPCDSFAFSVRQLLCKFRAIPSRGARAAVQKTTARTSLYKTNFSPDLDGRAVEKRRDFWSSCSHQCPQNSLCRFSLQRKPNRHRPRSSGEKDSGRLETFQMEPCG